MEEVEDEEEKSSDEQEDLENITDLKTLPKFKKVRKRHLFRRPTNLKLEGDFYTATENAENFIEYILTGRPNLARTPTTLKLEGDMEKKTETKEKYVPYETSCKRPLIKKSTNLHLEGLFEIRTENQERFLPSDLPPQRPPLIKRSTNLHLEGILELQPLYKDEFVEYKEVVRLKPKLPIDNLHYEDQLEEKTERHDKLKEHRISPVIPFLREDLPGKLYERAELKSEKAKINLKSKDTVKSKVHTSHAPKENKTEPLNKFESKQPDHNNAYVNFYRDAYGKFSIKKDVNEPQKQRRKTNIHVTLETDIKTHREHKRTHSDFSTERQPNKRNEKKELNSMIEKAAPHPAVAKPRPLKKTTDFKLEGPFECQPEYRKAYIDYITREQIEKQTRNAEILGSRPPRIFKPEDAINNAEEMLPKSKLPIPQRQSRRQRCNSLSPSGRVGNKENMEDVLFGSKIDTRNRSRTVGPTTSRYTKPKSKPRKRYGSPVLVENLAYTPSVSPVQAILREATRGRIEYDDMDDPAFVLIDEPCYCKNVHKEVCGEQRWMPSWYARPMK